MDQMVILTLVAKFLIVASRLHKNYGGYMCGGQLEGGIQSVKPSKYYSADESLPWIPYTIQFVYQSSLSAENRIALDEALDKANKRFSQMVQASAFSALATPIRIPRTWNSKYPTRMIAEFLICFIT